MSEKKKQVLAALVVDNQKNAEKLLKNLQRIDEFDKNGEITDAAIAIHTKRNRVKIKQTKDMGAAKGAVGGGTIGVLVGGILLGPAGLVIGGVSGAAMSSLYAKLRDTGVDDKFMRKTAKELEKGKCALFIMYKGDWSASRGAIDDAVKAVNAELLFTTLEPKQAAAVDKAVDTATEEMGGEEAVADLEVTVPDDLTQLDGIGPKVAMALNAAGIKTFEKLANTNEPSLRRALHESDLAAPASLPSWPMQAAFAAKNDFQGLFNYNQKRSQGKKAKAKPATTKEKKSASDDLTQLHGIGPRIASILVAGGITTYAKLEMTTPAELSQIISASGALPPSSLNTWPTQASYASKGDWGGLASYNKKKNK